MVKQLIPLVIAVSLIAAGTVYQGKLTDRWNPQDSELLQAFTTRLDSVPSEFKDWSSRETPLTEKEFKATNCTNYVSRIYTHKPSGEEVSVYLVVGTARHVTIHTPDWCYVGAGYEMEGDSKPFTVELGSEVHEFTTARFRKENTEGVNRLRIFWSYSDDGKWVGPSWPKTHFAGKPALCKVYLITNIGEEEDVVDSPSIEFAKTFLPILNEDMFIEPAEVEQVAQSDS
jgi:hypothetical protein